MKRTTRRRHVRHTTWKALNIIVGLTTILNVSSFGLILSPKIVSAADTKVVAEDTTTTPSSDEASVDLVANPPVAPDTTPAVSAPETPIVDQSVLPTVAPTVVNQPSITAPLTVGVSNDISSPKQSVTSEPALVDREPAKIYFTKLVCDNESDLPDWASHYNESGPNYPQTNPKISADTAADWIKTHPGCDYKKDWKFQYHFDPKENPGDNVGIAAGWYTSGKTGSDGRVKVEINNFEGSPKIWLREVMQNGYIPFSYQGEVWEAREGLNGSAEFYCNNDVRHFDNYEYIDSLAHGSKYYCVAWNVKETPHLDVTVNKIYKFSKDEPITNPDGWTWSIDDVTGIPGGQTKSVDLTDGSMTISEDPNAEYNKNTDTTYECSYDKNSRDDHDVLSTNDHSFSGTGKSFDFTPNKDWKSVTCTFTNTAQVGKVKFVKHVIIDGQELTDQQELAAENQFSFEVNNSLPLLNGQSMENVIGDYTVKEHGPDGYSFVSATGSCQVLETQARPTNGQPFIRLHLEQGENEDCVITNRRHTGTVDGYKFEDLNGDGKWQDNESGLPGVTIELACGSYNGSMPSAFETKTDKNGHYHFDHVPTGSCNVREIIPPHCRQTVGPTDPVDRQDPRWNELQIMSNETTHAGDMGDKCSGSISGHKYELRGDAKLPVDGWKICLQPVVVDLAPALSTTIAPSFCTGDGQTLAITDEDGFYKFDSVQSGNYRVFEESRNGWNWLNPETGSQNVTVNDNEDKTDIDFYNGHMGTLIVHKAIDQANGQGYVTNDELANQLKFSWDLDDDTLPHQSFGGIGLLVSAGSHSIDEDTVGQGYHYTGWYTTNSIDFSCANPEDQQSMFDVNISAGQTKEITICNARDTGTLTLRKIVHNNFGGTATSSDFTMHIMQGTSDAVTPFAGSSDGVDKVIPTGTYAVSESGLPKGYTQQSVDCAPTYTNTVKLNTAIDPINPANINLTNGAHITCTFTNTDVQPKLTVTKIVSGGTKVVADFPLKVNDTAVTSGVQTGFNAGTYTVSETNNPTFGYSAVITGECAANGTITLAPGDVKACTITNTRDTGTLIVKKNVFDAQGNDIADTHSFTVTVDGVQKTMAEGTDATYVLPTGSYTVLETPDAGYNISSPGPSDLFAVTKGQTTTVTVINKTAPPTGTVLGITTTAPTPVTTTPKTVKKIPKVLGLSTTGAGPLDYLFFAFGAATLFGGAAWTRRLRRDRI